MSTEQAFIEGFVKRAAEYGLSANEAYSLFKEANFAEAPKPRSSGAIGSEINVQNNNPAHAPGQAAVMDFQNKNMVSPKRPAYTPTVNNPSVSPAVKIDNTPLLGNVAGTSARLAIKDYPGAALSALGTGVGYLGRHMPLLGGAGSYAVSGISAARDYMNHVNNIAEMNKRTEMGSAIPRG
jgi:hypothetical protein